MSESAPLTFRLLSPSGGYGPDGPAFKSGLTMWHWRVLDKPIVEFDDEDLCRSCRQQFHLDHVIPVAIERLRCEPIAGKLFDGELLTVLSRIDVGFWQQHPALASRLEAVLSQPIRIECDDDPGCMKETEDELNLLREELRARL